MGIVKLCPTTIIEIIVFIIKIRNRIGIGNERNQRDRIIGKDFRN